jgi:hypothetical protein
MFSGRRTREGRRGSESNRSGIDQLHRERIFIQTASGNGALPAWSPERSDARQNNGARFQNGALEFSRRRKLPFAGIWAYSRALSVDT